MRIQVRFEQAEQEIAVQLGQEDMNVEADMGEHMEIVQPVLADHRQLGHRDAPDQHPIQAITALTAGRVALTISGDATNNMIVRFTAPCDSADITVGIAINGVLYQWQDAAGASMLTVYRLFDAGATVDILVDRENLIAHYMAASPLPYIIEYPSGQLPDYLIPGRSYWEVAADMDTTGG